MVKRKRRFKTKQYSCKYSKRIAKLLKCSKNNAYIFNRSQLDLIKLPYIYDELYDFEHHKSDLLEIVKPSKTLTFPSRFNYVYAYALHLLFFGLIFILPVLFYQNSNISKLGTVISPAKSSDISLIIKSKPVLDDPKTIVIPNLALETQVSKSNFIDGTWVTDENTASYDTDSSALNESRGHTLIFAHARPGLFRNLMNISQKDSIYIIGEKGKLYEYKITEIETVDRTDTNKLSSLGDHNLTLITCQGEDDKYRFLVKATLQSGFDVKNEGVI